MSFFTFMVLDFGQLEKKANGMNGSSKKENLEDIGLSEKLNLHQDFSGEKKWV